PDQPLPLQGIKVIELGSLIAGPYAGTLLAQFGAEVIKIETPVNGDPLRKWRKLHDGTSLWWYSQSRNKKSVTLDISTPQGQALIAQLVAEADVLVENYKVGQLAKYGLDYESLKAIKSNLIYCSITGFGQTGPYARRPGYD
ncbi:CoA transferase, partial [Escherichia coli]|nr:CoA transferase [Escherichia coli]